MHCGVAESLYDKGSKSPWNGLILIWRPAAKTIPLKRGALTCPPPNTTAPKLQSSVSIFNFQEVVVFAEHGEVLAVIISRVHCPARGHVGGHVDQDVDLRCRGSAPFIRWSRPATRLYGHVY